jgi:hypothetical protein
VLTVYLTVIGGKMTKRRGRGEGSVYRRKDGRCIGEYEDANGKKRYVSGKTKAEVRQKLRKMLTDRDAGIAYDSENLTVGGYLDRWLDAIKGSVRERTWQRHEPTLSPYTQGYAHTLLGAAQGTESAAAAWSVLAGDILAD